jgi:flavin-dependent thymidylate synthase
MNVTLMNYTPLALETLLVTKSTRLKLSGSLLADVLQWPEEKKQAEWKYMQGTIKSSWEFVDYIFVIEDVTRAFTHQLVRHRVGTSFAQQSQRSVDMSEFEYLTTGSIRSDEERTWVYDRTMKRINEGYQELLLMDAIPQDARGILPTNILTNIIFKANLRTLHGMCAERLCVKAQGEFQDVMRAIRAAVIKVHPWAEPALRVHCAQTGTCMFPAYQECPIKPGVFNPETGIRWDGKYDDAILQYERPMTKDEIQAKWEVTRAEAQPVAPKE